MTVEIDEAKIGKRKYNKGCFLAMDNNPQQLDNPCPWIMDYLLSQFQTDRSKLYSMQSKNGLNEAL